MKDIFGTSVTLTGLPVKAFVTTSLKSLYNLLVMREAIVAILPTPVANLIVFILILV